MSWEFTTIINLLEALRPWKSKPKEKKKLAERRAKRAAKDGLVKQKEETKMHDISKTITLEDLTNPEKNK